MHYAFPKEFALGGQGTMAIWLKADDWRTPERQAEHRQVGYRRFMRPVDTHGGRAWGFSFEIPEADYTSLRLNTHVGGMGFWTDVTPLVNSDKWFNLLVRWRPHPDKQGHTRLQLFINGQLIDTQEMQGVPNQPAEQFFIGVPRNGGQPWRGVMDEFSVWKIALDEAMIQHLAAVRKP
jgi:hypothetical protein